jgi:hypothetical protein
MARLPSIEFVNWLDPEGYRILNTKPPEGPRIVRNGKVKPKLRPSYPLAGTPDLFLIFARTADTPEGLLRFVQQYGPLTHSGNDPDQGDGINLVINEARLMQGLIGPVLAHRRGPELEADDVAMPFSVAPGATIHVTVVWDPVAKTYRWEFHASTLLNALWLQFGQTITRGAEIQACVHCGEWFEAGRGSGRRAGAKFCSEDHKIAYHSLKRSRGR